MSKGTIYKTRRPKWSALGIEEARTIELLRAELAREKNATAIMEIRARNAEKVLHNVLKLLKTGVQNDDT